MKMYVSLHEDASEYSLQRVHVSLHEDVCEGLRRNACEHACKSVHESD